MADTIKVDLEGEVKASGGAPPPPPAATASPPGRADRQPAPGAPRAESAAAPSSTPKGATSIGPDGRTIYHYKVDPPPNFDPGRAPDAKRAPLGWLKNDEPWNPYGRTEGGKIRKRPVKPRGGAGDDPFKPTAGARKDVEDMSNLSAYLDRWKKDGQKAVDEWRRRNPDVKIGDVIDPRDVDRRLKLEDPLADVDAGEVIIGGACELVGALVDEDPPEREKIRKVAKRLEEASRYWGVHLDNKAVATWGFVIGMIGLIGSMLFSALLRWWGERGDKKRERELAEEAA